MKPTVGFIGLGIIGLPMAGRLLEHGLPLVVWNRSGEKADALVRRRAMCAGSPRELAARADIAITMVTDGRALESVALGPEGMAAGLTAGKVHCDMSTIDPGTSRRLAAQYASRGAHFVHAPVLGNKRAAAAGTLLIFAGGSAEAARKCEPVFAALGKKTWHGERPETATCVKLACNLLLGGMMELLAESLVFAAKAGVEPRAMLEIFGSSALDAPMYQSKGETIAQRNFTPSFSLRTMLKDLGAIPTMRSQKGPQTALIM
jgi:3-hydroxyisobutyrate dehydrogenase-like beta-hydroxyacid dehydrogenase